MNRYFFYQYFTVCLTNIMLLVPYYLVLERYSGAILAIFISPFIGYLKLYLFTSAISKFPGKGITEILSLYHPRWVVNIFSILKSAMVLTGAILVVGTYAIVVSRYLNPDANIYIVLILLLVACGFAATRSTLSVMFVIEIMSIITIPFIIFIMLKTIRNPIINYDTMHVVLNHYTEMPSLLAIASACFLYTGYISMSIFNRIFPPNFKFKWLWAYPIAAFFILLVTFFVPIGVLGTESVEEYYYLWTAVADATRMPYGFIERMLFIFLFILLNLSVTYTVLTTHQAIEFIKTLFPKQKIDPDAKKTPKINYVIYGCVAILILIIMSVTNDLFYFNFTANFLIARFIAEIFTTLWLFIVSRKKVRKYEKILS